MPIQGTRLHVALRDDHRAAIKEQVSVLDLDNDCWGHFACRAHPKVYERLMDLARTHRVHSPELQHIMSVQEALPLVVDHGCIAFLSQSPLGSRSMRESSSARDAR